ITGGISGSTGAYRTGALRLQALPEPRCASLPRDPASTRLHTSLARPHRVGAPLALGYALRPGYRCCTTPHRDGYAHGWEHRNLAVEPRMKNLSVLGSHPDA